jgi:hypothetical protein
LNQGLAIQKKFDVGDVLSLVNLDDQHCRYVRLIELLYHGLALRRIRQQP